jgi:hypothetical protein
MAGVARGKGHGARRKGFLGQNARMDDRPRRSFCVRKPRVGVLFIAAWPGPRMAVAACGCVSCDPARVIFGACRHKYFGEFHETRPKQAHAGPQRA